MANPVGKHPAPPVPVPTTPTVEAWRAMTPAERMDFQVRVIEVQAPARLAQARAKQARAEAARARVEATARSVLIVLGARGFAVTEAERERILAEDDAGRLGRWLARAVVAGSIGEVLDDRG